LKSSTRAPDSGPYSNHQRLQYGGNQRPESAGNVRLSQFAIPQHSRPQSTNQEANSRPRPAESGHSFVTAADLQNRPVQTGRRPTGARLPTPPPSASNPVSTFEPVQPRSGKTRLNLLNPMSLLARRRTSQAVPPLSPEALTSRSGSNFSETFDPRIKGKFVHDFSAPRAPKRNLSYQDARAQGNATERSMPYQKSPNPQNGDQNTADESQMGPWSGGNHTPLFTENFEEEQYPAAGPHVRKASDLTDLPLPKPPYARGTQKPADSNPISKTEDAAHGPLQSKRKLSDRKPVPDIGPPVPPKAKGEAQSEPRRISIDPSSTPPKSTPSYRTGRSRNVSGASNRDGLPKHMKSTSSRFSFDMIGAAEQERLLEDRHRQKALEKKSGNADGDGRLDDELEDDFDYDDIMDDDGLEERIPGVNTDLEEEGYEDDNFEERIPGVNADSDENDPTEIPHNGQNLGGFTFQQSFMASPLSPYSPGLVGTPRDANGDVIGFAVTKNSPYLQQNITLDSTTFPVSATPSDPTSGIEEGMQGLGLQGINVQPSVIPEVQPPTQGSAEISNFPHATGLDDDDLYFDDGIIGGPGDFDDAAEFDESVFDNIDTDEYGRPLKPLSSLATLYSPPMLTSDPSPSFNKIDDNAMGTDEGVSKEGLPPSGSIGPQPSIISQTSPLATYPSMAPPPTHGLTQDSLAAYQSALAAAAHLAAASGKFRRDSTQSGIGAPSEQEDTQPGLIPDSSHTSHYEPFSPNYELEDDFDYDDALEDDPIIAAANAEALANDYDGFYGQEFGFYSAPAAGEAEFANGGYFGPRGVEGINRSTSGRVVSREPNLTPITERSEYSNRNSFMSPSMHGGNVVSPGLAQLAGMMRSPDYEGDISLDALLKLRRGAWGGSQASLHSSNGSPKSAGPGDEGSPVGSLPPWSMSGAFGNQPGQGHRRRNSAFSAASYISEVSLNANNGNGYNGMEIGPVSEDSSAPGSPTLTMGAPALDLSLVGGRKDGEELKKHRHTSSTESISYLKEDDPVAGERWILERRRTAESGEVELLGREVISGGRI
jgi:hypothetical protein